MSASALLDSLPDVLPLVEIRAMLADPVARVIESGVARAIVHPPGGLCGILGDPQPDLLAAAIAAGARVVIADPVQAALIQRLLPQSHARPALRYTFRDPGLPDASALRHRVESMQAEELESLRAGGHCDWLPDTAHGEILAAYAGNQPAAYCCVNWETERFADLYVETLPGHRSRSCGVACLYRMIRRVQARGKLPVGVIEVRNAASRRMVGKLRGAVEGSCVLIDCG